MKFSIRVDWMNERIEISPNLKIIANNTKGEKSLLEFQIEDAPNLSKYPVYKMNSDEVDFEDVFADDEDTLWWKSHMELTPPKKEAPPAPIVAPSVNSSPISTPPAGSRQNVVAALESEEPIVKFTENDAVKLRQQLKSIQSIFQNLQKQAAAGHVTEGEFLQKQQFLGEKMAKIMAELDQHGFSYE